jgi:hypothetical protein
MRIHARDDQSDSGAAAYTITHQSEFFIDTACTPNAMRIVRLD